MPSSQLTRPRRFSYASKSAPLRWMLFAGLWARFLAYSCMCASATENSTRKYIIVGAGPGGLQWGTLLEHDGVKDYVILEQSSQAGSFFEKYPRSRKLISVNRKHMHEGASSEFALRHDWHSLLHTFSFAETNMSSKWNPNADELVVYLQRVASALQIQYNSTVVRTHFNEALQLHEVHTANGHTWLAEYLIIATGMQVRQVPKCLSAAAEKTGSTLHTYESFPNLETGAEEFCRGKRALVFGGGNAAFETADLLAPCASAVTLIYKHRPRFSYLTHYVGDVRIANAGILDRYQLKSLDAAFSLQIPQRMLLNSSYLSARRRLEQGAGDAEGAREVSAAEAAEFERCGVYEALLQGGERRVLVFAGGFSGQREGVVELGDADGRFPAVEAFWGDPAAPRRYFAGNLMHGADYRRSAGGFIHGFRYSVRAQYRHLLRGQGAAWPHTEFAEREGALRRAVGRVQHASGLYQMQDFLADVIALRPRGPAVYYEEVPEPWVDAALPAEDAEALLEVKFAFADRGAWTPELVFDWSRVGRNPGLFLHPVVTPRLRGRRLAACHAVEDEEGRWQSRLPLTDLRFSLLLCEERLRAAMAGDGGGEGEEGLEEAALARLRAGALGGEAGGRERGRGAEERGGADAGERCRDAEAVPMSPM